MQQMRSIIIKDERYQLDVANVIHYHNDERYQLDVANVIYYQNNERYQLDATNDLLS